MIEWCITAVVLSDIATLTAVILAYQANERSKRCEKAVILNSLNAMTIPKVPGYHIKNGPDNDR